MLPGGVELCALGKGNLIALPGRKLGFMGKAMIIYFITKILAECDLLLVQMLVARLTVSEAGGQRHVSFVRTGNLSDPAGTIRK